MLTPSLTSVTVKLLREQVPGKTFTVLYLWGTSQGWHSQVDWSPLANSLHLDKA